FDCFGFWTARLTLVREEAARLCVTVPPLELPAAARAQHGGDGGRDERRAVKSPELLDNRAYIPGDDPRRINWKLYGHSGDLYVRTESADRPPRACLTLIVDTEFDGALFTPTAARAAVDALCAAALAFARDARRHGDAAHILYTRPPRPLDTPHLRPQECSPEADAHTLAYPAALPLGTGRLPPPSPDALPHLAEAAPLLDAVYFALPRTRMPASALERFTRGWPATGRLAVVFICTNDALSSAARENVRWCGGKEGVYADAMRV
ncbi:MAG: DUF58 domain-containing protein, partial [Spirochaetaceae bacterium]|nr:DUF58 domain-containing protein [Spirochaetaceae bacterium]